ncbi:MAG: YggS family pyridoxal phosphate-dependent enzyme [Bacteroidota bacterium]
MPHRHTATSPRLAPRIDAIQARIAEACRRAGRDPRDVVLVGVSKTHPLPFVREAAEAGIFDFGENRPQELEQKAEALPGEVAGGHVRWHMIGHLQRNKAKIIAEHADVFHGLDSVRLANALSSRLEDAGRLLACFIQVNISGEDSKYGVEPEELPGLIDHVAGLPGIDLKGLMGMAAYSNDPETARPAFRRLRELRDAHVPAAPWLSMGMSGDFEVAIEEGATHIRVGSAIFGQR